MWCGLCVFVVCVCGVCVYVCVCLCVCVCVCVCVSHAQTHRRTDTRTLFRACSPATTCQRATHALAVFCCTLVLGLDNTIVNCVFIVWMCVYTHLTTRHAHEHAHFLAPVLQL